MALRRFFNGRPTVLFEHGKLYEQNLAAARMDINEFLPSAVRRAIST